VCSRTCARLTRAPKKGLNDEDETSAYSHSGFWFALTAWDNRARRLRQTGRQRPNSAATMQFIQEKLSEQGRVGWAETMSNHPGFIHRWFVNIADVMADPAACTLYTTETYDEASIYRKGNPSTLEVTGYRRRPDHPHSGDGHNLFQTGREDHYREAAGSCTSSICRSRSP